MSFDNSHSPAKSLIDARRKLLNQLRLSRSKWREVSGASASEMGGLDSNMGAWSKTVWAETASPGLDSEMASIWDR